MISVPDRFKRLLLALALLGLVGCGATEVIVEGNFPKPLIEPLPVTIGLVYTKEFSEHEFFDAAVGRNESQWLVKTGSAQVEFWNTLLGGMFTEVVRIRDHNDIHKYEGKVAAVLIPSVVDLQYTIPTHTNVKVYEIWMKYRFRLVPLESIHDHEDGSLTLAADSTPIADWTLSAYGKTPTAFLQSDSSAVNLAAVVALRDAGANFVTSFQRVPDVATWLEQNGVGTPAVAGLE